MTEFSRRGQLGQEVGAPSDRLAGGSGAYPTGESPGRCGTTSTRQSVLENTAQREARSAVRDVWCDVGSCGVEGRGEVGDNPAVLVASHHEVSVT